MRMLIHVAPGIRQMSSSQSSPPSTPPPRPPSTRSFGSPLRPQSPPLPSGATPANPRARVLSHHSTPPSRSDSVHRISSSGTVNASTASLPNPNQPDRTRSKARDLLRKHYGLGVGPPPPSGKPQDPMDLGESMPRLEQYTLFTALYFYRLSSIRCQSLLRATDHDLVVSNPLETRERAALRCVPPVPPYRSWKFTTFWFRTEIRSLDSDRQSLVYNHHHELIAASDTISAVSRSSNPYKTAYLTLIITPRRR